MENLALIPARGGSKRLKRKNIREFAGRPMIEWTIDAARDSGVFLRVVVSTDDEEIASIASAAGAEVLMRGEEISNDQATLLQVIQHAVDRYAVNSVCLLLANCPLRNAEDIQKSSTVLDQGNVPAALSVSSFLWTPPFRALALNNDGVIDWVFKDWSDKKSQLYPEVVCPTGAIYWCRSDVIKEAKSLYVPGLRAIQLPWHRSIDIDTLEDFQMAECIKMGLDAGYRFDS